MFRPLVLALCLALPWPPAGVAVAAEPVGKAQVKPAAKPAVKAKPKAVSKAKAKSKRAAPVAKPLPTPKLDLTLPKSMVNTLEPDVGDGPVVRKPILPSMFPTKPESDGSPFQLNGRLISNEMQLQMRNDSRRDVDGAALDFEFRN